jgi:hypothetical protein
MYNDVWEIQRPISCEPGRDRLNNEILVRKNGTDEAFQDFHTSCSEPIYIDQCITSGQDGTATPDRSVFPCQANDILVIDGFCNADLPNNDITAASFECKLDGCEITPVGPAYAAFIV